MKIIGLDDREYILNLKKLSRSVGRMSSYHKAALDIIDRLFPSASVYNEVTLPGCRGVGGTALCADIFLPQFQIIIEVHGEQHYKFSEHFHKTEAEFKKYQRNDIRKEEWCNLNEISYVELKYDEQESWEEQIKNAVC